MDDQKLPDEIVTRRVSAAPAQQEPANNTEAKPETRTVASAIWHFINSSFGLWFLSTCVVGLITFAYTKAQEKERVAAEEKQMQIEHARRNASLVTVLLPYLASAEEKQWRMAIEVTKYLKLKGELPGELESALMGIVHSSDTATKSPGQQEKINAAATVIDIPANPAPESKASVSTLPPRVYIQIADESQRPLAQSLQAKLQSGSFLAPGVENVGRRGTTYLPARTEVRYYRDEERQEALQLISILKAMDLGLPLNETPQKVKGSSSARPRHYEVWFAKS